MCCAQVLILKSQYEEGAPKFFEQMMRRVATHEPRTADGIEVRHGLFSGTKS